MHLRISTSFTHLRLAWLLGLLLLLPLAQAAATWHLLSHVNAAPATSSQRDPAIHEDHCNLCLTAAAIVGGAIPSQPAASIQIMLLAGVADAIATVWIAGAQRPYQSRAPPVAQH